MGSLNEMARLVREELLTLIQPVTLLSVNPERSTGKITGRFRSSGMLFDYKIGGKTVSYKPVGAGRSARADAEAALSALADAWEVVAELAQSRQDTRCQKPDGTIYGTRGKCKQGRELKAEPKPSAKQRYKELSSRVRAGNAGGWDKRNAAGARRALGNMIENRGAAAPAAAKPKRKRKSRKSKIDLRRTNKPPRQREAAEKAAYEAIISATKRREETERASQSIQGRLSRVGSAIGKKVNAAKQALASEMKASRTRRANASRFRQQKKAAEVLQSPFTRRRDSYNAGYKEVMARLDWEG